MGTKHEVIKKVIKKGNKKMRVKLIAALKIFICVIGIQVTAATFSVKPENIVIQLPVKANAAAKTGVQELQKHLQLITGVQVPVSSRKAQAGKYVFYVGIAPPDDKRRLQTEEACYRVTPQGAWLYGNDQFMKKHKTVLENALDWTYSRVGTMFAVYNFLERELKVRWPAPGDENIVFTPQNPLKLHSAELDWRPQLVNRLLWGTTFSPWYYKRTTSNKNIPEAFKLSDKQRQQKRLQEGLWQRRMRMGQSKIYSHRHSFTRWWKKYGKSHPEFFALNAEGKREPTSPKRASRIEMCVSNPGLKKEVVKQWLRRKKRSPYMNETINVCENDGARYCRCKECQKLDVRKPGEDFGFHMTDRYVYFANQILKLARKYDPNVQACMFAYMEYRFPPRKTRIDKDIVFSFVPKLWDSGAELQKLYSSWRKMGARNMLLRTNELHIDIALPMGFEKKIFDNFQVGVRNKIIGTRYDAIQSFWPSSGIVNYILARAFYDPAKNFAYWEQEYCNTYGAACSFIKEYFRYWREQVWNKRIYPASKKIAGDADNFLRQGLYWSHGKYYCKGDFDKTDAILRQAAGYRLDSRIRDRLKQLQLANRHARLLWRAMRAGGQYSPIGAGQQECQKNFKNIKALTEFRLKNKDKLDFEWGRLMRTENYSDGACSLLAQAVEGMTPFAQLPQMWRVAYKPVKAKPVWLNNDSTKKWKSASIISFSWRKIAPESELGKQLKKSPQCIWYAIKLPDKNKFGDKEVYLVFGGIRGRAVVYVNGKALQCERVRSGPLTVRIDKNLKKINNKLCVKVFRRSGETSGIWRPVWLFTK